MVSSAPFDIGTLIEATPGVYGGRPCLAGTRFPVLQVAVHYREGIAPRDLAERFGGLDLAAVHAAVAYYLVNREAMDAEIDALERDYQEALEADRKNRLRASA